MADVEVEIRCPSCGGTFRVNCDDERDHCILVCPYCGEDLFVRPSGEVKSLMAALEESLARLEALGLVEREGDRIRITELGKRYVEAMAGWEGEEE